MVVSPTSTLALVKVSSIDRDLFQGRAEKMHGRFANGAVERCTVDPLGIDAGFGKLVAAFIVARIDEDLVIDKTGQDLERCTGDVLRGPKHQGAGDRNDKVNGTHHKSFQPCLEYCRDRGFRAI